MTTIGKKYRVTITSNNDAEWATGTLNVPAKGTIPGDMIIQASDPIPKIIQKKIYDRDTKIYEGHWFFTAPEGFAIARFRIREPNPDGNIDGRLVDTYWNIIPGYEYRIDDLNETVHYYTASGVGKRNRIILLRVPYNSWGNGYAVWLIKPLPGQSFPIMGSLPKRKTGSGDKNN